MKELLLQHILQESLYTLEYLNQQIIGLELGYMEVKDRPSLIANSTLHSIDHKLKQEGMLSVNWLVCVNVSGLCTLYLIISAAQMWLLGRLLPMMVGDKIPHLDEHWSTYTDLLDIVDLLLAPAITEDEVCNLATMISDHHHQFKQLYPHASITPKMHYLVHMPRLILK